MKNNIELMIINNHFFFMEDRLLISNDSCFYNTGVISFSSKYSVFAVEILLISNECSYDIEELKSSHLGGYQTFLHSTDCVE